MSTENPRQFLEQSSHNNEEHTQQIHKVRTSDGQKLTENNLVKVKLKIKSLCPSLVWTRRDAAYSYTLVTRSQHL